MDDPQLMRLMHEAGYTFIEKIGQGGFADVYTVQWNKYPNIIFAAKIFHLDGHSERAICSSYLKEIKALKMLDHPNIIQVYNYTQIGDHYLLLFEYCPNGSLYDVVSHHGPMNEATFIPYAKQCLEGLKACHEQNLCHRDIKPGNILFDEYFRIKICDFGLALPHVEGQRIKKFNGSFAYLAPEILRKYSYDPKKADIWALGVTFVYILTGRLPWDTRSSEAVANSILSKDPIIPNNISLQMSHMLEKMLCKNPKFRPGATELLQYPFFKPRNQGTVSFSHLPPLFDAQPRVTKPVSRHKISISNSTISVVKKGFTLSGITAYQSNTNIKLDLIDQNELQTLNQAQI